MNEKKIYSLFSVPIFHYKVENYKEINEELINYIFKLKKKDKIGNNRSNIGGWHSPNFELLEEERPIHFIIKFKDFLKNIIVNEFGWEYLPNKQRIVAMWAIINKKNSFNIMHNHQNCYLSGSYYVKKPEKSGDISFFDPVEPKTYRYPEKEKGTFHSNQVVTLKPEEGDLLVFPSYLYHSVQPNLSDEDRVVISFNIDLGY